MMAKQAATKIRLRNKHSGRPPRPDSPILYDLPPTPAIVTRRRRSLRPRRWRKLAADGVCGFDHQEEEEEEVEEEEEEEKLNLKKLRLVVKLPCSPARRPRRSAAAFSLASSSSSSPSPSQASSSSSSSYADEEELGDDEDEAETVKPPKKRRIDRRGDAMSRSVRHQENKINASRRCSGDAPGNLPSFWNGTPMPERKELELILHKLQKKDTYGAFAEPVDQEELPDYHDVIEHPMDFGTIRKKLNRGAYRFFEQFEDDVLLICNNAMQYNAPDTIYFRQACAIQDMARKQFQNVRVNVKQTETVQTELRSEGKARLISIEKKTPRNLQVSRIQCKSIAEPLVSDISSGATLASGGDTSTGLSTVNDNEKLGAGNGLLDASSFLDECKQKKPATANGFLDASSSLMENKQEKSVAVNELFHADSSPTGSKQEKSIAVNGFLESSSSLGESKHDKGDDFSVKDSPSKLMRKMALVDENRRATYNTAHEPKPLVESDLIVNLLEDEQKQLVPVGLDTEQSYARSLARFTASLGPAAWEIVSRKIEKTLPSGIKFGPGWVGEYEPLLTPYLSFEKSKPKHTSSSFSRAVTNDKAAEMKSKSGQIASSSNMEFGIKKQLTPKASRKSPNSVKSTSNVNSGEQKPRLLGAGITALDSGKSTSCDNSGEKKLRFFGAGSTAQSKVNGNARQKPSTDSKNTSVGVINSTNSRNLSKASVRVKEEIPCEEEVTVRRQDVIHTSNLTQVSTQMISHQQNPQPVANFPNVLPQVRPSLPGIFPSDKGHLQTETQKVFFAASSKNIGNAPEIGVRGSNNVARVSNSFPFIPNNQIGANCSISHGNNYDQASSDPFKLASFSGMTSNQPNLLSNGTNYHSEQSFSIVSPLSKENYSPTASASARAWMSVGSSCQWKSVSSKNPSEKPTLSSPFCNPTWKPPSSASPFNGYSMLRPSSLPLQVEASQVKNRGLVIFPQLISADLSKYPSHPSCQGSSPQPQKSNKRDNLPPDLNIGYQAPASPIQPSSTLAMDSQQPDLALQL